jgi:hypothetical protein
LLGGASLLIAKRKMSWMIVLRKAW